MTTLKAINPQSGETITYIRQAITSDGHLYRFLADDDTILYEEAIPSQGVISVSDGIIRVISKIREIYRVPGVYITSE